MSNRVYRFSKIGVGTLVAVVYLIPVYWMFTSGLKTQAEIFRVPPTLFPDSISLLPLQQVLAAGGVRYFLNSMFIGTFSTIITLSLAGFTGFALARLRTRFVWLIVLVFLVAQMLPPVLRVTPLFIIFNELNMINTYTSVILSNASLTMPFAVVMLRTTFLATPMEIEEASLIDGCSRLGSFLRVSLPMAKPGFAVVGAMSFVWAFGDFILAISLLQRAHMHPATVGLYNFIGAEMTQWNNVMAFAAFTALPLILLFMVFQKQIIQGLSAGSFR